jgi:hypothetical protein
MLPLLRQNDTIGMNFGYSGVFPKRFNNADNNADRGSSPGNVSTHTAELETIKILVNSTISTPGAVFITVDVENFYLETPLDQAEYVKIPVPLILTEIMVEYALADLVHNGFIYCIIKKGMYGLPQSGILANNLLKKRLEPHGYYECTHTPGLWRHKTQEITFTLVVDDFGIKQTSKADSDHLIATLRQYYGLKVDRTGSLYCGVTMKWDYGQRIVDLSMYGQRWKSSNTPIQKRQNISHTDTARRSMASNSS